VAINRTLDEHFPVQSGVRIIAEPGRYYVASAYTLATNIIATREMTDPATNEKKLMYYVNDGVYGSFNCVLYDHYIPEATPLKKDISGEQYTCSIWGPTCEGLDCITSSTHLPKLTTDDWIIWKNMGAYTISGAVQFNGIPFGKPLYFMAKPFWDNVQEAFEQKEHTPALHYRMNSECGNEVEDEMLPWEDLEDPILPSILI